jgi:hypothetical protein
MSKSCRGHQASGSLSRAPGNAGAAVAFSRTGDPSIGEFSDAIVLRKFGDVPDDLSGL